MKVEHAREGDASNDPLEISTSQYFYFSKILLLIWCFVVGYFLRSNILFHFLVSFFGLFDIFHVFSRFCICKSDSFCASMIYILVNFGYKPYG